MSETTPHHHPEYEETFARVATILDVMAQEQLALQRAHDRTERALAEYIEHAKLRDAETTDKLNGLIELMNRHLRERGSH
jgi:hypothetical protein